MKQTEINRLFAKAILELAKNAAKESEYCGEVSTTTGVFLDCEFDLQKILEDSHDNT